MNDDELSTLIKTHATRFEASSRLRADLAKYVVVANAKQPQGRWFKTAHFHRISAKWRHLSMGMACGVLLTITLGLLVNRIDLTEPSSHRLVAAHVQAMKTGALYAVASSDQHTVKPWFQGKLSFSPPVPTLLSANFTLLGGRVERLHSEPIAALVYVRNQHIVTVFVRPKQIAQAPALTSEHGFHVLTWSDGAMQMSAVSDIEATDLSTMQQAWTNAAAHP